VREVIFSGFASDYAPFATNKLNVQALMNSFNWSLDNRIHGATSFSGGKVKRVDSPFVRDWLKRGNVAAGVSPAVEPGVPPGGSSQASPSALKVSKTSPGGKMPPSTAGGTPAATLDLRGRDFSFDPRVLEMRAESGGGQHGLSFDNRGRKFVCSNSSHVQTLMYEERYAARNPYYSMPRALVEIAVDGGAAPVYRISPDEPWRVIRTQWRVSGLVPGPIEGGGRPSGYFTGATGITIYRGDAFGEEFVGDAFVGDAGGNLVHRKKILPDGVGVKAVRPTDEQNVEFLASTDNWFRPVQMANAPDGCLYICDMYREVIEHPWSLPDSIKKHLDLNSGNDRGRIYRIVPEKFKARPLPRLSKASTSELVKLLEHPNGWHRDTAARLLYERQDKSVVPKLAELVSPLRPAYTVTHALHALEGMKALKEGQLTYALWHSHPAVRENALKLAEPFLSKPSEELWQRLRQLAERPEPDPKDSSCDLQLALTLGETQHPGSTETLWTFLKRRTPPYPVLKSELTQNDPAAWLEAASVSARRKGAFAMFTVVTNDWRDFGFGDRAGLLSRLASVVGAKNDSNEVAAVVSFAASVAYRKISVDVFESDPLTASRIIIGLDEGLRQKGKSLQSITAGPALKRFYDSIRSVVTGRTAGPEETRAATIQALGTAPYTEVRNDLLGVLTNHANSGGLKQSVVAALAKKADPSVGSDLLSSWPLLTPHVRAEVISALLLRPERIRVLLSAIDEGKVARTELSVAQQSLLRSHSNNAIREMANQVLGRVSVGSRQSLVQSFQPALMLKGVPAAGRDIFRINCAACHKFGDEGEALGPDLATVKNAGKEKLLTNILDPNREVNANYFSYLVETKDGESLTGIIVNESANSVTLRMAGGIENVVPRGNIITLQSQGKSLMPEGLEEGLSQQDMADLLEFIVAP
jgi:putative membrane-bound dehydrogenase-like protein